ncbi:MAG TPA: methionyl-tRNA formyltransferase [Burkholderiaceae bacterium]|nr:methionyl-tRNA formyltransferase [Burkholderiaceae bacterium]
MTERMRIVYAGTPEFAAAALAALIEAAPGAGWSIPLVLTQPDRPAGRGMKLTPSAVKALALAHGLTVATPATLSLKKGGAEAQAAHAQLRAVAPDVLVVAAYGLILPQAVLDIARGLPDAGCGRITALNIHASLLPRWRGAAPVARAIEAGDERTGVTIMQMDAGLDTGPMLLAEEVAIERHDTTATLTTRLAALGARLIVQALHEAARGGLPARTQPSEGVTYAHKLDKREALLDWNRPATVLAQQVRAFDPFPVATCVLEGVSLKLWRAEAVAAAGTAAPGTVVAAEATGVRFACGAGDLLVTELQRPGGKRLPAREFLAGMPLRPGMRGESQPGP